MATLLLDTSVIIDAVNEKNNRRQFLRGLVEHGNILACCPINITEIYAGMRPKEEAQTTAFLASLDLYPITFSVARLAGELKRDFGKKGTTLSVTDSLIAAVAIECQLALLTDNTKDFPMKNLKLYPLPEH
jgi:predicted nucleic acid-binding protein